MISVKRFLAILLCFVTVISCFACADNGSDDSERAEQNETNKTDASLPDVPNASDGSSDTGESEPAFGDVSGSEDKMTAETESDIATEPEIETFSKEATVIENGGSAHVTTSDGIGYVAQGYSSVKNNMFSVAKSLKIVFDDKLDGEFNRVTLCYSSTSPMRCTLTYTENGEQKNDGFFLEAGDNIFSGLIESYLKDTKANGLESLTLEPLDGNVAEFMLYNAVLGERYVYSAGAHYLENDRFKVGIRLVWGGGITYIEDKQCKIEKLGNLINIHDAGRLVQQSYYGTAGNDEYKPGVYNGTDWVYNPVQGGDQYWNHSRLIDIIVTKNSVYVKSQPQDWSLDGIITPSYMENTYTVYSDRIVVDNRFVDFSGWEHRFAHQELPAFYTVSYLERFSYYNGLSPWTDGELISHDNLPFCGGEEKAQCYFKLLESNTETWCAWTNPTDDYGIGLYVPGADLLLAGRFGEGSSKKPSDNSCSYVAPVNTLMIKSFVPIEYGYMITAGSLEEIRDVFKSNRDFAENAFLSSEYSQNIRLPDIDVSHKNINFATAEHNKYLDPMNSSLIKFNSDHNAVELVLTGADPQVNIIYGNSDDRLMAESFGKIEIEYMIPTTNSPKTTVGEMFLCTGDTVNAEGGKSVQLNYIADGGYHTAVIDLSTLDFWSGKINSIRFDFFNEGDAGDTLFVRSIKLVK